MTELRVPDFRLVNYRCFDDVHLTGLGRVNLIVGKNGCGKTALLEALRIWASGGSLGTLVHILAKRDEFAESKPEFALRPLFGRTSLSGGSGGIMGELLLGPALAPLSLHWSRIQGQMSGREYNYARGAGDDSTRWCDKDLWDVDVALAGRHGSLPGLTHCSVPSAGVSGDLLQELWDSVQLTDGEQRAIEALRTLLSTVERISFRAGEDRGLRFPIAKIRGEQTPVPLAQLGEGAVRIFGLAIALSKAESGLLLVDEVESGIHYSAQESLWRILIDGARSLDAQVFATTHSWDCVQAFARVAGTSGQDCKLVRISDAGRGIRLTSFSPHELEVVAREGLEVR